MFNVIENSKLKGSLLQMQWTTCWIKNKVCKGDKTENILQKPVILQSISVG